jgi:hypothetical protein
MFRWKDNRSECYDDLFDVVPPAGTLNGMGFRRHDVFGFVIKNRENAGEDMAYLYRCQQVESAKRVGSGEEIFSGDRLFAYPVTPGIGFGTPQYWEVSPVQTGTADVDYVFCGWAKFDAGANDATVILNFNGYSPAATFI